MKKIVSKEQIGLVKERMKLLRTAMQKCEPEDQDWLACIKEYQNCCKYLETHEGEMK